VVVVVMVMVETDDWPHNFDTLAKDLGTPSNTLRRYFKLFQAYIPNKLVKRGTRFNKEAKELFEDINKMYGQRMSTDEIVGTLATTRMPTLDVRPSAPPAQAPTSAPVDMQGLGQLLPALIPLAERFVSALETIAAALASNRAQDASKASGQGLHHPDHETGQDGADMKLVRTREEIIAEVHRLRGLGWGAGRIRTAMVRAGWPSLAGVGHQLSKSTVARIIKGDIK